MPCSPALRQHDSRCAVHRRVHENGPLTGHLGRGDAIIAANQCAIGSSHDWLSCLARMPHISMTQIVSQHESPTRSLTAGMLVDGWHARMLLSRQRIVCVMSPLQMVQIVSRHTGQVQSLTAGVLQNGLHTCMLPSCSGIVSV